MEAAHLEKLRRFGLTVGLVLATYLVAGISIAPDANLSPFGITFTVSRPDLLPIGLALASLTAMARFHYYGVMLGTSPRRKRRDLLDGLTTHSDEHIRAGKLIKPGPFLTGRKIPMYWGPRKFDVSPWDWDEGIMKQRAAAFDNAFPKFFGARASVKLKQNTLLNDAGQEYQSYSADVMIPRRCRAAAILEDIDYTSPIWVNAVALLLFVWKLARPG